MHKSVKNGTVFCAVFMLQCGVARSRLLPPSVHSNAKELQPRGDCGFILARASASSGARLACSVRGLSADRGARALVPRRLALRLAPLASPTSPQRTAQQPQPQLGPPTSRCFLRPWFRNARRYSLLSEKEKSVALRMG